MRSSNPTLGRDVFAASPVVGGAQMTINGTINRCLVLLAVILCTAGWVWSSLHDPLAVEPHPALMGLIGGGAIFGLVVALITVFKASWSPITAPIYALCEGVFLGGISAMLEMQFPGIAIQAVGLTFGTLVGMLLAYRAGVIRATEKFKAVVCAATLGIFVFYLASFLLGIFGVSIPYIHGSGPIGIGVSLFVVAIAALNLILDFDLIEQGAKSSAPRYMEWYGAFGLMVTLVWLYVEFLILLAKLRSND